MPSLRPLSARLRARIRPTDLMAQATQIVELSPAIVSRRPPAISLAGEFDRAEGYFAGREKEYGRVAGGDDRAEGATIAYALRDALVAHGVVYTGGASQIFRREGPRLLLTGRPEEREAGLLTASPITELFFGDWLVETPGLCLLAAEMKLPAVTFAKKPWLHEAGYLKLLDMAPEPIGHARFETLWMVDDRGTNDGRAARFRELRRRVRDKVLGGAGGGRIYLARGNTGQARHMVNVVDVEAHLTTAGFEIVHPERETAQALARKLASAKIVVTVEGSAQVHALLAMPQEGRLVVLQPPDRFTAPGKDMADMAGMRYAFMVGEAVSDGFMIDLDRLSQTIELAESTA